jgi:hypothetical protein
MFESAVAYLLLSFLRSKSFSVLFLGKHYVQPCALCSERADTLCFSSSGFILGALALGALSGVFYALEPASGNGVCTTRLWMSSCSVTLLFSFLFAKTWCVLHLVWQPPCFVSNFGCVSSGASTASL